MRSRSRRKRPRGDVAPPTRVGVDRAPRLSLTLARLGRTLHAESSRAGVLRGWPTRATLDELLREKIQQGSRAGGHQAMKAFRSLCARGTRANREGVRRALERFNIVSTDDILDAVMTRFDVDGDGAIDFREFATAILGEKNFPADDETRGGEDAARVAARGGSAKASAPFVGSAKASAPFVSTLAGAAGTAPAVTRLLREKIAAKFAAGGAASRRAFASLDEDGDGALNLAEFRKCLSNFLIAPPEETTLALYAAHADTTLGGVSRATFASAFSHPRGGPRDGSRGGGGDSRGGAQGARYRRRAIGVGGGGGGGAGRRHDVRGGARRLSVRSGRRVGSRAPRREGRADLDGRVTATAAAAAVATLRAKDADIAVRRAQRGFVDGFGRDRAERSLRSVGPVTARRRSRRRLWNPSFAKNWRVADPGAARGRARVVPSRVWTRARRGWIGKEEFGDALRKCHVPVTPSGRRRARRAIRRVRDGTRVPRRFRPTNRPRGFSRRERGTSSVVASRRRGSTRSGKTRTNPRARRRRLRSRVDYTSPPSSRSRRRRCSSAPRGVGRRRNNSRARSTPRDRERCRARRFATRSRASAWLPSRTTTPNAAFARLAGDAFASTDEVPTAAFVRRALPPSYAERPARADVLRELRDAGAADERDVRAVLSSCGVEMDEVARRAAPSRVRGGGGRRTGHGARRRRRLRAGTAARGDPSPRRPPSITASRRRGTRDRARRRLRRSRRRAPTTSRAMDQDGRRTEARASSPS